VVKNINGFCYNICIYVQFGILLCEHIYVVANVVYTCFVDSHPKIWLVFSKEKNPNTMSPIAYIEDFDLTRFFEEISRGILFGSIRLSLEEIFYFFSVCPKESPDIILQV